MSFIVRDLAIYFILLGASMAAAAQVAAAAGQTIPQESKVVESVPRVPGVSTVLSGLNAGISESAVHNSFIGWYSVLTPAVSYTFSQRYSADASTSLYFHHRAENTNPATLHTQPYVVEGVNAGDTVLGFHATFLPESLLDTISAYMTAPTGDRSSGLGTGRVTFDLSNHVERYYKQTGFLVDLGVGDSSDLANNILNKNYSSLGALAHFEAGTIFSLPLRSYFETVAYEQLPIGNQTVYAVGPQGTQPAFASGTKVAEDNGFISFAGIPWKDHVIFSGYYNRSLRRQSDTVSFGVTYLMRGRGESKALSLIDRALREAEKDNP